MAITEFSGEYRWLSNFYPCVLYYNYQKFLNSEAAYQCQKCANEEDKAQFSFLKAGPAKRMGRAIEVRSDWNDIKVQEMEEITFLKYMQNKELREKLIATFPEDIIEGNRWGDTFWGVCDQVGANVLGQILMNLREDIIDRLDEEEYKV